MTMNVRFHMFRRSLSVIAILSASAQVAHCQALSPVCAGKEGERAFTDLGEYYKAGKKVDYKHAVSDLTSTDPAVAGSASRYLLALLKQSHADETNGRDRESRLNLNLTGNQTPRRLDRPLRFPLSETYRKYGLTKEIIAKARGPLAAPLAQWLIEHDDNAEAFGILKTCPTAAATTSALKNILNRPWSSKKLTLPAIEMIGTYKLKELAPQVVRYGTSYRASLRACAEKTCRELGVKPESYDVRKAITPWLDKEIRQIPQFLPPIAKDAKFARFSVDCGEPFVICAEKNPANLEHQLREFRGAQNRLLILQRAPKDAKDRSSQFKEYSGWIMSSKENNIAVLDLNAKWLSLTSQQTKIKYCTFNDEALRMVAAMKANQPIWLSQGSYNAWQYERLPVITGGVLYTSGDQTTAAELLFPFIDSLDDDRELIGATKKLIAFDYAEHLLSFFKHRDYADAALLSQALANPIFAESEAHNLGVQMLAQLKERNEDFHQFKLPTHEQWKKIKGSMGKQEQIKFLATRLRLLNCIQPYGQHAIYSLQWGPPGEPNFNEPQCEKLVDSDATDVEITEVINPFNELIQLVQTREDVISLLPFLRDEQFIPTVHEGSWYSISRPYRVDRLVTDLINWVAGSNLVDYKKIDFPDSNQRKTYIEQIEKSIRDPSFKAHARSLDSWEVEHQSAFNR